MALSKLRHNEEVAEHISSYSAMVCFHKMRDYALQVVDIYIRASLKIFLVELENIQLYAHVNVTISDGNIVVLKLCKFCHPDWVRTVAYDRINNTITCGYGLL